MWPLKRLDVRFGSELKDAKSKRPHRVQETANAHGFVLDHDLHCCDGKTFVLDCTRAMRIGYHRLEQLLYAWIFKAFGARRPLAIPKNKGRKSVALDLENEFFAEHLGVYIFEGTWEIVLVFKRLLLVGLSTEEARHRRFKGATKL